MKKHISIERNLRLYGWYKIFMMRAFLPMTALYLVEVGGISLAEVGLIASMAAVMSLISQIPTGYFADHYTRKAAMVTGASILVLSGVILSVAPSFIGGAIAAIIMALGYSFLMGTGSSLVHDTMEQLGRSKEYVKFMGRAQSKGLIGNVVLIGLVPSTYAIDKRLPFILGTVAFIVLLCLALRVVEPVREKHHVTDVKPFARLIASMRTFIFKRTFLLFFALGLIGAVYTAGSDYNNLVFVDLGLPSYLLGTLFAAASFVGAIGGYFLHHAHKLSLRGFITLDIVISSGFLLSVGLSKSLWVAIGAFLVAMSFWRLRQIVYQDQLLKVFKGIKHKATLVSTIGFFEQLNRLWIPLAYIAATTQLGFYWGYAALGASAAVILAIIFIVALRQLAAHQAAQEY